MHEAIWNRDECQDAIDEVLLKTALSSLLEIEGEKLLAENEILKNDPRFQLSPEVDKKIQRALIRFEYRNKFSIIGKKARNVVSKVAVIFLAVFIGFSSTFAVSADFRRVIYTLILSYDERYTQIEGNKEYKAFVDNEAYTWEHTFAPTMVPQGYSVVSVNDNLTMYTVRYENTENLYIEFKQMPGNGKMKVDTEKAQIVKHTNIGDSEALFVEKDGVIMITWEIGEFLLYVESNDKSDIAINFAENIKLMR